MQKATAAPGVVLTPQQVEFLASDVMVEVLPTVAMGELALLGGRVGPLEPQVPARVPLWLAVHLKKRNRCRMRPPEWLAKAALEKLLERERALGNEAWASLPSPFFVELAMLMLEHAREAVAESERVRQLVEQVLDARRAKVLAGLASVQGPTVVVKLNNLTLGELNLLRPFLAPALVQFDRIAAAGAAAGQ